MKNEEKKKKGFWSAIMESMAKTGGCSWGPGEGCGGPATKDDKTVADDKNGDKSEKK